MRSYLIIMFAVCLMHGRSQTVMNTDTIGGDSKAAIFSKALFSDSLCSSFCIVIRNEVKAHKHLHHSEHVMVLEGEGMMKLGDRSFAIKKGDLIFIPKNTVHAVKSGGKAPLKVLSIQAPLFDGGDRVFVEEK